MKKKILCALLVFCLTVSSLGLLPLINASADSANTDWFKDSKYGIFVHYLNQIQNNSNDPNGLSQGQQTSWNNCVNAFNVNTFANTMEQSGAAYVIFTIMQQSKYMIAPNATYDSYTGYAPGEACAQRDLINDLYNALSAKNIKLMLYFTGDGPWGDAQAAQGLALDSTYSATFKERWGNVVKEYSDRYGSKIAGWWIDGCYVNGYDDYTLNSFSKKIKSGNPNSIVAFNGGVGDIRYYTAADDYTAGERNSFDQYPTSRFIKGKQWQCLSFMGDNWSYTNSKYTSSQLIDYVTTCNKKNGVVSIDIGLYRDGSISSTQQSILSSLKNTVRNSTVNDDDSQYVSLSKSIKQRFPDKLKYEVFQKFETTAERANCGNTYNGDVDTVVTGSNALAGTGSLSALCNTNGWTLDSLVNTAPQPTISHPKGIFFRMKTNAPIYAAFTADLGSSPLSYHIGTNKQAIFVSDYGKVSYGAVPSNFSGYVFVPVDKAANSDLNLSQISKIAVCFNSWDYGVSWNSTVSYFDNVGYYSVIDPNEESEYTSICNEVRQSYPDKPVYEVVQKYESTSEQANCGTTYGGDVASVLTGSNVNILAGNGCLTTLGTSDNYTIDNLVNNAPTPSISHPKGIFFRIKTNAPAGATFMADLGSSPLSYTLGSGDQVIFISDNESITQGYLPANFSGYAFIPLSKSNNTDLNAASISKIAVLFHNWSTGVSWRDYTCYFDNVGYYTVSDALDNIQYLSIFKSLKTTYPDKKPYEVVQKFESSAEQTNCGATYGGDTAAVVSDKNVLAGIGSLSRLGTSDNYTVDNLMNTATIPTIANPKGVFFRLKTNAPAGATFMADLGSSPLSYTLGSNDQVIFISDSGTVTNSYIPANFSGYAFVPLNKTTNADLTAASVSKIAVLFHNWSTGISWKNYTCYFDNVGYYTVSNPQSNLEYLTIVNSLKNEFPDNLPFEVIQKYETTAEKANCGTTYRGDTSAITTSANAIAGTGSQSITCTSDDWTIDNIMNSAPAPTIANANGIFFRMKTNAPVGANFMLDLGSAYLSYNIGGAGQVVFVSDNGTVYHGSIPSNFSGYAFVPANGALNPSLLSKIAICFNSWDTGISWKNYNVTVDNVGYYSVS